ncbi:hypothetical protein [Desertivirga xinjiangensis]|uniref:hypothetical protein n=1 Tax=Desertivirga xinjiangensis TaxID=539206 RepID=UPI00210CC06C|nr:hypothetical protein [Pedobacter xinjiangensis]
MEFISIILILLVIVLIINQKSAILNKIGVLESQIDKLQRQLGKLQEEDRGAVQGPKSGGNGRKSFSCTCACTGSVFKTWILHSIVRLWLLRH